MKIPLSLLIFYALIFCHFSQAQSSLSGIPLSHYFDPQAFPSWGMQNWSICQDQRGLIYIANNFGLLEFDGTEWHLYPVKDSPKLRVVFVAQDGKIYTGGQKSLGYFMANEVGNLVYTSLLDQVPEKHRNFNEVWRIYETTSGIYFCLTNKVFLLKEGRLQVIDHKMNLNFLSYANGRLYGGNDSLGLFNLKGDQISDLHETKGINVGNIRSVLPFSKTKLLIVTHTEGIFVYDGFRLEIWNKELQYFLKTALANCAIRLSNGDIAIGTQNKGLLICKPNGEKYKQLSQGRGLASRTVHALYQDHLSNLWVGLSNGINYIELSSPFTRLNDEMGVPGAGYAAYKDQHQLYLGTTNGLFVSQLHADGLSDFQLVKNTEGQAYHISEIAGDVLLGHDRGAYRIDQKTNEAIQISEELGAWKFMQLRHFPKQMIGGTYTGFMIYEKDANGHWAAREKLPDFHESSRVFEEDENGLLWMSHGYKGVYRFSFDEQMKGIKEMAFYNQQDGFPSDVSINVVNVQNRLVYTAQKGIFSYDSLQDSFVRDHTFDPFLNTETCIGQFEEGPMGNIYYSIASAHGVLKKINNGYEQSSDFFHKIRSYASDDLENITVLDPQNILIGAKNGFIHYNPFQLKKQEQTFEVLLRKVECIQSKDSTIFGGTFAVAGKPISQQVANQVIELPYVANGMRFTFSTPFFDGMSKTSYQVYLQGFDQQWSAWSLKTEKEYSNLPEGTYTFKARAKNVYGALSEVLTYRFSVLPPWYRTTWAYLAYSFIFAAVFGSGLYMVDRKHRKEKAVMSKHQAEKLQAKEHQLAEVAKKSEEEINKLKHEKLKAELTHKNKELATSAMNLLNKNEFMMTVKHHLQGLKRQQSVATSQKEINKIIHDIDKNIAHDDSWKQFEFHFDQVHGNFAQRLKEAYPDLTAQDMKLCAYLRMNLSTKEIANLLNIATRGVEAARYRLRKKLQLERNINLTQFLMGF